MVAMKASEKLFTEARKQANKLGHAILIGLPVFADQRQPAQLFDTGGVRKSYNKWRQSYEIIDVIWPDGHPNGAQFPVIHCPDCGQKMEVGYDKAGGDYYAQCRNKTCNFDGWHAPTLEKLVAENPKGSVN